jgi:hypothetical protein
VADVPFAHKSSDRGSLFLELHDPCLPTGVQPVLVEVALSGALWILAVMWLNF